MFQKKVKGKVFRNSSVLDSIKFTTSTDSISLGSSAAFSEDYLDPSWMTDEWEVQAHRDFQKQKERGNKLLRAGASDKNLLGLKDLSSDRTDGSESARQFQTMPSRRRKSKGSDTKKSLDMRGIKSCDSVVISPLKLDTSSSRKKQSSPSGKNNSKIGRSTLRLPKKKKDGPERKLSNAQRQGSIRHLAEVMETSSSMAGSRSASSISTSSSKSVETLSSVSRVLHSGGALSDSVRGMSEGGFNYEREYSSSLLTGGSLSSSAGDFYNYMSMSASPVRRSLFSSGGSDPRALRNDDFAACRKSMNGSMTSPVPGKGYVDSGTRGSLPNLSSTPPAKRAGGGKRKGVLKKLLKGSNHIPK